MNIFESSFKATKNIGTLEVNQGEVFTNIYNLSLKFGLYNQSSITNKSTKGITISKSGKKFKLSLMMFEPPISIEWTTPVDIQDVNSVISQLINKRGVIGYLNELRTSSGVRFQFGISR